MNAVRKTVLFGEIMMRLSPPGFTRLGQACSFDIGYGGSEANVAVSLASFGVPVDYVTRLPSNDLGDACIRLLRQYGVGTEKILRGGQRLGIYFLEAGAMQRGSKVIYDRANSAIASIDPGTIAWRDALSDADWFHWTGITPAIAAGTASACLEGLRTAREMGITISCDLNYRKKLWKWGRQPGEVMAELVSYCDIAIGNEEDAENVFGIKAPHTDVLGGKLEADSYRTVCEALVRRFPNLRTVAVTLRGSISASHNAWSGVLWNDGTLYLGPSFDLTHIVDRVGAGDAFAAGLIYGLRMYGDDCEMALNFAVAASCLKHSILGDLNLVTVDEVEKLMRGDKSGRVAR